MEELLALRSKFLSLYAHGQVQHQTHRLSLKACKLLCAIHKYKRINQNESAHTLKSSTETHTTLCHATTPPSIIDYREDRDWYGCWEGSSLCLLSPPWRSRISSDKHSLHPSTRAPSHPPSTIRGTIKLYWSRVDLMLNGEMAKGLHFEMIYWHETLSSVCCLGNCANVKAVYPPSPWPFLGIIQRDPLWMWNTAQWVRWGRVGWEVTSTREES